MVDPAQYIKEGLKIVKTLMKQGNLQAALRGCQELLKVNPYDRGVQSFLKDIQEQIIKQNEKKVDADIEATMHLWKEKRFVELQGIYARLYPYAPQHKHLRSLIEKLNAALFAEQKEERTDFFRRASDAIQNLFKEKKLGEVMQACNELLSIDPVNKDALHYLQAAKDEIINQKLKQNQSIIESADFERALEVLESTAGVDPANASVQKMIERAKWQVAERRLLAEKIHLNESVARMKELFKNAEYEKVLQSCEEIDRLDPGNFTARVFRKKAATTIHAEIEDATVAKLKKAWAELAREYEKNGGGYVKV